MTFNYSCPTALRAAVIFAAFMSLAPMASASDAEDVAAAVERMRKAMLAGDGTALATLVDDKLSYGHSSGATQNKTQFVESLDKKNAFKSLVLTKNVVDVSDDVAIVRHVFDAENNLPDGKTSAAYITVLQVWQKNAGGWKLLARQSAPVPRP